MKVLKKEIKKEDTVLKRLEKEPVKEKEEEKDKEKEKEKSQQEIPKKAEQPKQTKDTVKPVEKAARTGDNSNMILWITLFFISSCVVTATTVISRKIRHREN